jgi:hypothetical protein
VEAGQDLTLVAGCDCIVASYRGTDKLKRFDLELALATLEPGLLEMLIGGDAILSGSDVIGQHMPVQINCTDTQQPVVAIEAWQTLWEDDHPASTPNRYLRWVFPATRWQLGDMTLENALLQPTVTGYTRGNTNWGEGIFDDQPEAVGPAPAYFYDDVIPDAACGWQSFSIT